MSPNLDDVFAVEPLHERVLMVALARDGRAGERWRAFRSEIELDDLWDGKALDLLPLVYRALVDEGADDPDLPRLRGVHRRTWYVNHLRFRALAEVLTILADAGVDTLVLKGGAWALDVYPDIGLRPMHDVDVLVRPGQVGPALDALEGRGWSRSGDLPANYARRHQEIDVLDADRGVIDLHWHVTYWLMGRADPWTADEPFWQRSVPLDVVGTPSRALDPTDALVHAVVHAAWAGWRFAPQWIPDAVLILGDGTTVEWDRVVDIAVSRNLTLPVRRALEYLRDRFGAPVPADVVRRLDVRVPARARRCFASAARGPRPTPAETRLLGPLAPTYRFWITQTAPMDRWSATRDLPGWLADHWRLDSPWQLPAATATRVARRLRRRPPADPAAVPPVVPPVVPPAGPVSTPPGP